MEEDDDVRKSSLYFTPAGTEAALSDVPMTSLVNTLRPSHRAPLEVDDGGEQREGVSAP